MGAAAIGSRGAFYIESFDMPGFVLSPAKGGAHADGTGGVVKLALERASGTDAAQLWYKEVPSSNGASSSRLLRNGVDGPGRVILAAQKRASPPTGLVVPHRGAAVSREWELVLVPAASIGVGSIPLVVSAPYAEYAPASFWLTRAKEASSSQAQPDAAAAQLRQYLLVPLNELQDEHYTVYWCKPASAKDAARPPRFCL